MMRLPIEIHNPASILALGGLMRLTGALGRMLPSAAEEFRGGELSREVTATELVTLAKQRFQRIASWPDDAVETWWIAKAKESAFAGDLELSRTLCMLGSQNQDGEYQHSKWRMIFGQQRWIAMVRKALDAVTEESARVWLTHEYWPRTEYMGMTGVDSGSYTPPAHNWTSDTSKLSKGHPVSLWLMWEGLHLLPSMGGHSHGWVDNYRVRWPIWHEFRSAEWLHSIWISEWLHAQDLDALKVSMSDEEGDEIRSPISARSALAGSGVSEIYESKKAAQPAPYAWRLQAGRPK